MRKTIGPVLSTVFLFTSLLAVAPAAGIPPSGGGESKPILQAAVVDDLLVTLDIPKNSPFLAGQDLSEVTAGKAAGKKGAAKKGAVRLQVPVVAEKFASLPMAVVDNNPLTLGAFRKALQPELGENGEIVASVAKQNPASLLNRLVDSRVMVREAREIGFDTLPEVAQMVKVFRRQNLRSYLAKQQLAGIKADPAEVERLYVEAARESRIKAMLFNDEADAQAFAGELKAAESFDGLAARFVEAGKGEKKGGAEGEFVRLKEMQPELVKALEGLAPGQVTPVLPQNKQFTVIQLLEMRVPENPEIRKDAEQRALNFAGNMALVDTNKKLLAKHVVFDKELFDSLDFTKDFEALLQDKRVLAEIKGDEPFTVAELAEALKGKYYHGVQRAIDEGKVKEDRISVLNEELYKRAWLLEATEQGIDQTEGFKRLVEEYEDSIIFGAFVQKAVVPSIQLVMDDLRNYYKKNIKEYASPEMVGLRSMVFRDKAKAREALDSLKRGTDYKWLQSTVEGLVPHDTPGIIELEGKLFTTETLPADVAAVLAGATLGQYRLYQDGKEFFYVLMVEKVLPPSAQPFEAVQSTILRTVFNQKLEKAMVEWGKKLRKVYKVDVYVKGFNKKVL
ncbi:MAG: peptidyl-prolyl cis-trans isomerase [Pseudomonadota bacterium]